MNRKSTHPQPGRRGGRHPHRGAVAVTVPAVLALLAALSPAAARAATPDDGTGEGRWIIGVSAVSSHIGADDPQPNDPAGSLYVEEVGGGLAVEVGRAFSPTFVLRAYLSGALHETSDPDVDFGLAGFTVEAMLLFNPGHPLRPYLVGGLGGFHGETDQGNVSFSTDGGGMVLGGGLRYALGRVVALDFGLRAEFINWEQQEARIELPDGGSFVYEGPVDGSGTAGKFTLGVIFRL